MSLFFPIIIDRMLSGTFFYPITPKLLLRPKAGDKSTKYKYLMIERIPPAMRVKPFSVRLIERSEKGSSSYAPRLYTKKPERPEDFKFWGESSVSGEVLCSLFLKPRERHSKTIHCGV